MSREIHSDEKTEFLTQSFLTLGISLSGQQTRQLLSYYSLLEEKNKVMNLTAITEFNEVVQKHFLDSTLISTVIDINSMDSVIDVGSGAGFPGIPLKILFPGMKMTLLDSLNKRVQFMRDVIDFLKLKQISSVHARAEEAAREPEYREKYDLCVSRAVAHLNVLAEFCLPFVRPDGLFVAYKTADVCEECEEATEALRVMGGEIQTIKTQTIPGTNIRRSFVIIKKIKETPSKYPRRAGMPARSPVM